MRLSASPVLALATAGVVATATAAGCTLGAAPAAEPRAEVMTERVATGHDGAVDYADVEYDEDYSLSPTRHDPLALTPWNDGDPERPTGFPKTFLYEEGTCGPAACANIYNLYAAPGSLSPRWAYQNGCLTDPDDVPGGARSKAIVEFLDAQLPAQSFQPMWTPASWSVAEAGGDPDAPEWSWEIATTLIDARKPFVAATTWGTPPRTEDAGHFVTVADYAVRDGRPYVLIIHFGHYKWYPYLDKGAGSGARYGFHTRWLRNWRAADLGQKYFRIRPDSPVPAAAWARWHAR